MGFFAATSEVVGNAGIIPTTTTTNNTTLKSEDKQQRLELINYVKAHFDLIAVTLLIAYLGYSIYKLNKGGK
jgi:hypothetical protein